MSGRLQSRVAIVTGAGDGIGAAIANRFLAEGASVVAVDLSAEMPVGDDVNPARVLKLVCDVAAADTPDRVIGAAVDRFGKLDILVNNAGVSEFVSLADLKDEVWARHFDVNVHAIMRLSRRAAPELRKSEAGRIINTASISAVRATPNHSAYTSSKAALVGLTRALAVDLGPDGINVNAILPGMVLTRMMRETLVQYPEKEAFLRDLSVLGRMCDPDEIAGPALFLASDDASFMTGQGLVIDGGVLARL